MKNIETDERPQPGCSAILIICDRAHLAHLHQAAQELGGGGWLAGLAEFCHHPEFSHIVLVAPDDGRIQRREPMLYFGNGDEGLLLAIVAGCKDIHGTAKILRLIDSEARRVVDPVILAVTVAGGNG